MIKVVLLSSLLTQQAEATLFMLCFLGIAAAATFVVLSTAIRVVPEYQRPAIFRLGRFVGVRGPGLMILFPFIDAGVKVDLREQERSRAETAGTRDGVRVSIDFAWRYKVLDPVKSVLEVGGVDAALQNLIANMLRSTIGEMDFTHAQIERRQIAEAVRPRLEETAEGWGVKVIALEIREIARA